MTRHAGALTISADNVGAASILTVDGVLDSGTYLQLRDTIIKAALDEPTAVIVDVGALRVPAPSAWTVFTSARWHVSTWPDVPVLLVCPPDRDRDLKRIGIGRFVPIHTNLESALEATQNCHRQLRRRARVELPASLASLHQSRALVCEWLGAWSQSSLIPVATVVVNVLVENVLKHTASAPVVTLESNGPTVTIAVNDENPAAPARHEDRRGGERVSGLAIVASVCRAWGTVPTLSGKTVWAVIGPENRL